MAERQTNTGCKGSPRLKYSDVILMEETNTTPVNPPPSAGARAAIAMLNDLDSDEDSQVGAAINLRVNIVSINQNLAQDEGEDSETPSGLDLKESTQTMFTVMLVYTDFKARGILYSSQQRAPASSEGRSRITPSKDPRPKEATIQRTTVRRKNLANRTGTLLEPARTLDIFMRQATSK